MGSLMVGRRTEREPSLCLQLDLDRGHCSGRMCGARELAVRYYQVVYKILKKHLALPLYNT